jgi:hypothetical protein
MFYFLSHALKMQPDTFQVSKKNFPAQPLSDRGLLLHQKMCEKYCTLSMKVYTRPLQRSRARAVFSGKAGRLSERRILEKYNQEGNNELLENRLQGRFLSEFLPAPKKAANRGKPRLWRGQAAGHVSFGTFLCVKEKYVKLRGPYICLAGN